jgi:hypothetical protein
MARQSGHKVFIVRFSTKEFAMVRADEIVIEDPFTIFMTTGLGSVKALRTEFILDIESRHISATEYRKLFKNSSIYVECKGSPQIYEVK